jgi:hypothetical protein
MGTTSADVNAHIARVRALRETYWANGYRPVAIWSPGACDANGQPITAAGKRPVGLNWRQKALHDPPAAVTDPVSSQALSTGILCDDLAVVDVDVSAQPLPTKSSTASSASSAQHRSLGSATLLSWRSFTGAKPPTPN